MPHITLYATRTKSVGSNLLDHFPEAKMYTRILRSRHRFVDARQGGIQGRHNVGLTTAQNCVRHAAPEVTFHNLKSFPNLTFYRQYFTGAKTFKQPHAYYSLSVNKYTRPHIPIPY